MLTLPSNVKLYLATEATDLRKSFDGLSALVQGTFGLSATSGDLFIFLNRRGTQVRILFWDRDAVSVSFGRILPASLQGRALRSPSGEGQLRAHVLRNNR